MIGGGLAGLSAAVALADAGLRVRLLEQRPFLGGRASSYVLPTGEHIDNCQHVTLGCCTNLADFYRRVGAAGKISFYDRLVFADRQGRRGFMQASALPPPLHLAPALLLYPFLSWPDRRAIGRAMLAIATRAGDNSGGDAAGLSMLQWLERHRQSPAAIDNFWSVVLVSALNETLDRTDARFGLDVFWKAFLATRAGYRVGVPRVPLGELYAGCRAALESRGGSVALRAPVRRLQLANGAVAAVELDDGSAESAGAVVLAVPHDAALKLLPGELLAAQPALAAIARLEASPITGVHFWFDRDIMAESFLTVVGCTTQWIFNKSRLYGGPGDGRYLQLVISASRSLLRESRQAILDLCLAELRELLPDVRGAAVVNAAVIKEAAATFSPLPGSDAFRPHPRVPGAANLVLAGDWTATRWPATMEGAVRSGYLAAEALLADVRTPRNFLRPDLPPEGLARFF